MNDENTETPTPPAVPERTYIVTIFFGGTDHTADNHVDLHLTAAQIYDLVEGKQPWLALPASYRVHPSGIACFLATSIIFQLQIFSWDDPQGRLPALIDLQR